MSCWQSAEWVEKVAWHSLQIIYNLQGCIKIIEANEWYFHKTNRADFILPQTG